MADVARLASQKCDEHGELVEEALHGVELRGSFEMRLSRARARLAASLEEVSDALPEDDHVRRALWLHRSRLAMLGIVVADPWAMELLAMANEAEPRSTLPAPAPTEEVVCQGEDEPAPVADVKSREDRLVYGPGGTKVYGR